MNQDTTQDAGKKPDPGPPRDGLLLIATPAWEVKKPFHALAVVAGVARQAGLPVRAYDLNVDFYRHVSREEKAYWEQDHNDAWNSAEFCGNLWSKHEPWLTEYLDGILCRHSPLLVGFSVNASTRAFSIAAARHMKNRRPDLPVMFGGVDCFPREFNQRFLDSGADRYCDIICQGEAEISFKQYLEELAATRDWRTRIPGFAFYDGDRLIDTGDTELPTLQEEQPRPAYDLFDLSKYTKPGTLAFFLTRGCVYNCHFCSEKPNFKRFRSRSAEEAFAELVSILPMSKPYMQVPSLSFADSNLNANMKVLERFVDLILEHNVQITWSGQAHIHPRVTKEFARKWARAGFRGVFWGIETGSQHVVDLMNKRYLQSDARRILRDCSEAGIEQHVPIILGFPGETPEDVAETVEFILEFKNLPKVNIHLPCQVIVRPNSPLHTRYTEFGLADTEPYGWHTTDGSNTLPIRIARRFVVRQAHANPTFAMDKLVDTEEILNVKLNERNTSADLYRLLHEIARRGDSLRSFHAALDRWPADLAARPRKSPRMPGQEESYCQELSYYQELWNAADKDSPGGRQRLYRLILESLSALDEVKQPKPPAPEPVACAAIHGPAEKPRPRRRDIWNLFGLAETVRSRMLPPSDSE